MNKIRKKIEDRLDALEDGLKRNQHIAGQEGLVETNALIAQVSKFWSVLDSEQRGFINAARHATEEQLKWE